MYLLYLLILLPVYAGFFVGTKDFFHTKTSILWIKIQGLVESFYSLPKKIKEFIYFRIKLPKLQNKTRLGDEKALAERLLHSTRVSNLWDSKR